MISIAMATYNGARFIREQIESILTQTVQDFEVIISDDNSSDDTMNILKEYEIKDKRFRVYGNEVTIGFKNNFENAIRKCRGEYIALCDQDDIWLPNHIEMLLNAMKPGVQIVCGRSLFVDENNHELPLKYDYLLMYYPPVSAEDVSRHIFLGRSTYQGASMLIRSSFFEKALPIPNDVDYHDSWFAILACFTGGLVYVNKPTMRYRRQTESVTFSDRRCSVLRRLVASIVHDHTNDRPYMIQGVRKRATSLSPSQNRFLNKMEKMIGRSKCLSGRIANIPYVVYHYKSVFACDLKHILLK